MVHIKDHSLCQDPEMISKIIDANPTICDDILQNLNKGKIIAQRIFAKGLSADQVLLAAYIFSGLSTILSLIKGDIANTPRFSSTQTET